MQKLLSIALFRIMMWRWKRMERNMRSTKPTRNVNSLLRMPRKASEYREEDLARMAVAIYAVTAIALAGIVLAALFQTL